MVGEAVVVWADIFRDGHDVIAATLLWRREQDPKWVRVPMRLHDNDRWTASFVPEHIGRHVYAIEAWTDGFATWRRNFEVKRAAGQDVTLDALEGAGLLTRAKSGSSAAAAVILQQCEQFLQTGDAAPLLAPELPDAMRKAKTAPT